MKSSTDSKSDAREARDAPNAEHIPIVIGESAKVTEKQKALARIWFAGRLFGVFAILIFVVIAYQAGTPAPNLVVLTTLAALFTLLIGLWASLNIGIGVLEAWKKLTLRIETPLGHLAETKDDHVPRWDLLKLESELLQSRFDKYDQLVFQIRGWAVTLAVGAGSAYFFIESHPRGVPTLAALATLGFYVMETRWRMAWNKYVARYRTLRSVLHDKIPLTTIAAMDLTDHYRRRARRARYEEAYGKFLGKQIERAYTGEERLLPASTTAEMGLFYIVLTGCLLALPYISSL